VPVRREIRDLKENYPEQWVLYLLGLSSLQWLDQNDPLSYYGLASKYCHPYVAMPTRNVQKSMADLSERGETRQVLAVKLEPVATVLTATLFFSHGTGPILRYSR
jgi:hypothetical protein